MHPLTRCAIGLAYSVYTQGVRRAARIGVDPWEYGCYIHVEDLARATVCALTCTDPGHEVPLVVAEDISSRAMSSKEWAEHVVPHVPWRGGAEYDVDPYRALVDGWCAQRMLGWKPQYRWDG